MRSFWTKRAALFFTPVLTTLLLASCGGGGGSSSTPIPPIPPSLGGGQGSATSPVNLGTVGPPATYAGSIGAAGQSYYKFTTDSNGGTFKISLTNTHSDLEWDLYSSMFSFGSELMYCSNWGSGDVTCLTDSNLTPNTDYYLEVVEYGLTADTYTLTVSQIVSEGTPTSPVLLTVGTSHAGSVNGSGSSYYKFQTNSAGEYSVAISNSMSTGGSLLGINIFSTDFTTPNILKTCTASSGPTCAVNGLAANTYYYVQVSQGYAYDAIYNITVNVGSSEGSVSNPVALTYGQDHAGGVDAYGNSYYTFTPTNTGDSIITLNVPSTVEAIVYLNPDFSTGQMQACWVTAGQPCTVSGVNQNQTYYLLVSNAYGGSSVSYTLNVSSGNSEGSLMQPVQLTLGTAHSASIDTNGVAYYYFNTGPNGTTSGSGTYAINLSTSLSANWALFSDPNFSMGISPTTNLDANKNYYLEVINNSSTSGTFSVTVSTGFGYSEGSVNTPVALTEGAPYSGRIAPYGYSYYTFTPSKSTDLIRLTNVLTSGAGNVMWYLYSTPDFATNLIGVCNSSTYASDLVCSTQSALTAGTPYYLEVYNLASTANTYTVTVTPFDVSLGCNSGGNSTCINFESGIPTSNTFYTFVNGPTDIFTGATPWTLVASTIGGGAQSFQSTAPNGSKGSYNSCFQFTATNVKWIDISSRLSSTPTIGTDYLYVYVDGVYDSTIDSGNTAWNRSVYIPSSGGSHTYEWCYDKYSNATGDYADVDDIELNY